MNLTSDEKYTGIGICALAILLIPVLAILLIFAVMVAR